MGIVLLDELAKQIFLEIPLLKFAVFFAYGDAGFPSDWQAATLLLHSFPTVYTPLPHFLSGPVKMTTSLRPSWRRKARPKGPGTPRIANGRGERSPRGRLMDP